jgi:hypothetical protein
LSQSNYESEPDWLQDAEGKFHKINIATGDPRGERHGSKFDDKDNIITRWIYIIEDDSFEDGTVAMDVTERVERDMKGEDHKYRR